MTHLVIGQERRTVKVLVAIANGARLVTPAWVLDSLAKGQWQEADHTPLYRAPYR